MLGFNSNIPQLTWAKRLCFCCCCCCCCYCSCLLDGRKESKCFACYWSMSVDGIPSCIIHYSKNKLKRTYNLIQGNTLPHATNQQFTEVLVPKCPDGRARPDTRTTCPRPLIFPAPHEHPAPSQRPRVWRTRLALAARPIRLHSRPFAPPALAPCLHRAPTASPKRAPSVGHRRAARLIHQPLARRTPFPGARAVPPDSPNNVKDVQHETLECNR
jgi:hypothetical protein